MSTSKVIKISKILLVATVALYFTLVVFGNLTDYWSNYAFVEHVLMMDTTFESPALMWRAIEAPIAHHIFYWMIILWEAVVMILAWIGTAKMWKRYKEGGDFNESKGYALAGLLAGMMLWFLAFITIGGEWFAMWQSGTWNGLDASFRMFTVLGIAYVILMHNDR